MRALPHARPWRTRRSEEQVRVDVLCVHGRLDEHDLRVLSGVLWQAVVGQNLGMLGLERPERLLCASVRLHGVNPPSFRGATQPAPPQARPIEQVLEFFTTRVEAETMLGRVLVDEPEWRETLYIECVELVTRGRN